MESGATTIRVTGGDLTDVVHVGRGGHATVYRARQTSLGRNVAVKVLDAAAPDDGSLPAEARKSTEAQQVLSQVELAEQAEKASGEVAQLLEKIAHDPADHQARLDLAVALFAGGQQEAAMDQLLESFRRDRNWNDAAARKQLIKFWEALGPTHALTVAGRRRLSSMMFA